MKITEKPIVQPPPVTYVVEFTFEELVTLGVLSHRHEILTGPGGNTFYDLLPPAVKDAASARASGLNRGQPGRPLGGGHSTTTVNWKIQP